MEELTCPNCNCDVGAEELKRNKPMAVEEAAIDLSVSDSDSVVFRDAESEDVHVLYKRKDGHFGLIRPD